MALDIDNITEAKKETSKTSHIARFFYFFIFIILPHTINYKQNKSDNK